MIKVSKSLGCRVCTDQLASMDRTNSWDTDDSANLELVDIFVTLTC